MISATLNTLFLSTLDVSVGVLYIFAISFFLLQSYRVVNLMLQFFFILHFSTIFIKKTMYGLNPKPTATVRRYYLFSFACNRPHQIQNSGCQAKQFYKPGDQCKQSKIPLPLCFGKFASCGHSGTINKSCNIIRLAVLWLHCMFVPMLKDCPHIFSKLYRPYYS